MFYFKSALQHSLKKRILKGTKYYSSKDTLVIIFSWFRTRTNISSSQSSGNILTQQSSCYCLWNFQSYLLILFWLWIVSFLHLFFLDFTKFSRHHYYFKKSPTFIVICLKDLISVIFLPLSCSRGYRIIPWKFSFWHGIAILRDKYNHLAFASVFRALLILCIFVFSTNTEQLEELTHHQISQRRKHSKVPLPLSWADT